MKQFQNLVLEDVAFYDAPINELKLNLFAQQLVGQSLDWIKKAQAHFRAQPGRRQMPMPADLIDWISQQQGGHPSVEVAWSMMPRDESDSVVWTDEMSEAFGVARPLLLEGDGIAARMAFKEAYTKLIDRARDEKRRAVWRPSFGHDRHSRVAALNDAVAKGRLTAPQAQGFLPDADVGGPRLVISGPETGQSTASISRIKALLQNMPKTSPEPT